MIFEVALGSFSYSKKETLRDISFSVSDGEIMAVLGPNGVGKTTLLKCMMGLLSWSKGETKLDGVSLHEIPFKEFWSRVAYVPQAKNLTFGYSAREMVVMGLGAHIGFFAQPKPEDYERAQECLESIGVGHLADKSCTQMSGGELQMVLIARALMGSPELLVLDEPESGLDFKNQLIILETLQDTLREQGIASIINTHYPEHALKIADKALVLHYDHSSVFGGVSQVITPEELARTFSVNVQMGQFTYEGKEYPYVVPVSVKKGCGEHGVCA